MYTKNELKLLIGGLLLIFISILIISVSIDQRDGLGMLVGISLLIIIELFKVVYDNKDL